MQTLSQLRAALRAVTEHRGPAAMRAKGVRFSRRAYNEVKGVKAMQQYYFTFRSVTAAMEGQKNLERAGIRAWTVRTPTQLRKQGCGYSLRVSEQAFKAAEAILLQGEKSYQKCYLRTNNGQWQEVAV